MLLILNTLLLERKYFYIYMHPMYSKVLCEKQYI